MLRVGIVAVPIAASFAAALTLSSLTDVPSTFAGAAARWLLIATAATVVLVASERLTRRLAPLATLLALSLTFPDRAPPRFRIALRNGSTRQLNDRIAEARRGELGGTPAEAAERVLELVAALSLHDRTTRGHSERVRAYSRLLGEELGLGEAELDQLQWAGLLHDVGKLLIPDSILNKPGRLTPAEYEEVCKHPEYGHAMVMPLIPWLGESARAVWEHHERWDGGGYPAGLAGLDIALGGADRQRRRHVRRDDIGTLVQGAGLGRRVTSRTGALRRRAVRPGNRAGIPEHLDRPPANGDGPHLVDRPGPAVPDVGADGCRRRQRRDVRRRPRRRRRDHPRPPEPRRRRDR